MDMGNGLRSKDLPSAERSFQIICSLAMPRRTGG